jgi:hypothetical protein
MNGGRVESDAERFRLARPFTGPSGLSDRQHDESDQFRAEDGLGYLPRVIKETVAGSGDWISNGHPLAVDPAAVSTDPELPAFLRPPEGAPVYYGFPLLRGVESSGFKLGMITDFTSEHDAAEGDLFIVAPDGSRAGVVWCTGPTRRYGTLAVPSPGRWGIWQFEFARPLRTLADAQWALDEMLPTLRPKWERWAALGTTSEPGLGEARRKRWRWWRK